MAKKPTAAEKKAAKAAAATAAPRNLLAEAVNARNTNTPLMATEAEMHDLLVDPRGALVEFNASFKQGDKIAFRATELGMQVHAAGNATAQPAQAPAGWGTPTPGATGPTPGVPIPPAGAAPPAGNGNRPKITFATGIPLPAARRGGRGSTVYGFETMDVGHSFFIPASDDNPNPAKRIASTVSSASGRLEPKKFIVRSITVDDAMSRAYGVPVGTKGAGIWRTA
jgi:hypothetical protein